MQGKIYTGCVLNNIYFDYHHVFKKSMPFNILIGGRGTGKTYGALKEHIIEENKSIQKIIYLRTMQTEIDISASFMGNPYKKLNEDLNRNIQIKTGQMPLIVDEDNCIGYCFALSTFATTRGVDFSDVDTIIWDEFISEEHRSHLFKKQASVFYNLYETVNRNREIEGKPAVKVYFLSNATTLNSPLLIDLNLVSRIENMIMKSRYSQTIKERGIYLELLHDLEISEMKKDTALYKLTKGSQFYRHSIENEFAYDSWYNIKRRNLREYKPICAIDNIYIYRHKYDGSLYTTISRADCPTFNTVDTYSLWKRNYWMECREKYISGNMLFDTMTSKQIFKSIL